MARNSVGYRRFLQDQASRADLELDGRTAVAIGGSSGTGAAVAGVLAEEGCDVAVTYRGSRNGAEQAAADVRAHGRCAWVVPLELRRPQSATGVADTLAAQVSSLDAVVLRAGHNVVTPFSRITVDEWNTVLEVNLGGAFCALGGVQLMEVAVVYASRFCRAGPARCCFQVDVCVVLCDWSVSGDRFGAPGR